MKKQKIIFAIIILLFLAVNIPLLKESGYSNDTSTQQNWGNVILEKGLPELYSERYSRPPVYPPVSMYVLKFNAWLNFVLFRNLNINTNSYNFISKIIPVLCNLMIGVGLFFYFRKSNYKIALLSAGLYLFNLAMIYNAAYWGQIDSLVALFMFFSVLFAVQNKYLASTICLTLSIFVKLQGIILIPVLAVLLLRNANIKYWFKIIIVNLFAVFILFLPFITGGQLKAVKFMFNSFGYFPFITLNAYNPWYLLSQKAELIGGTVDTNTIWGVSLRTISLIIFTIYALMVMYQLSKKANSTNIILAASGMAFAFFMLPTQIHERYLFYLFSLFALVAITNLRYLIIYAILAIVHLFNLMMVLQFSGSHNSIFYPIQLILDGLINTFSFNNVAIAIAVIHTALFVYFTKIGIGKDFLKNIKADFLKFKNILKKWANQSKLWRNKELLIFLIAFIVIALFTRTNIAGPNDQSRIAAIQSIVENGTFSIENSQYSSTVDRVYIHGHYYSDKPSFSYLVGVPAYFILHNLGISFSNSPQLCYYLITLFSLGICMSIMFVYFFKLTKLFALPTNERILHTIALGIGTLLLPYALTFNNHGLSAAFLFIAFYLFLTMKSNKQRIIAGALAGLTFTVDEAVGLIFIAFFTILLLKESKFAKTKYYLLGAAIPVVLYLLINLAISGSIMPFHLKPEYFNYPGSPFPDGKGVAGLATPTINSILTYAYNITLGFKGLFTITPLLIFSIAGLVLALENKKLRNQAILVIVASICVILFFAAKTDQYGGCNFGFRYIVPLIPVLYAFVPYFFKEKNLPPVKALYCIILLYSIFITISGIILGAFTCSGGDVMLNINAEMFKQLFHSIAFFNS